MTGFDADAVREHVRLNPDASAVTVLGALEIDPVHIDDVRALVDEESYPTSSDTNPNRGVTEHDTVDTVESSDDGELDTQTEDETPTFEAGEPVSSPTESREIFAERLKAAKLDTQRFIDVHDGEKRSTNHTQHEPDSPALRGNYGVYGGGGAGEDTEWTLVDIDVDDYDGERAPDWIPQTFTVASPHTDGRSGGHFYVALPSDAVDTLKDAFGTANPNPPWGEIRVQNQYCVGPGSQLNGCSKEWCDDCAHDDGGYYRIKHDEPIAQLSTEEFVEALQADMPDREHEHERSYPDTFDDLDLDDYQPEATDSDERTEDIRDVFAALERLDARQVADDTIVHAWNPAATTSGNNRAFAPTWGPSANGTANIVDDRIWQDTGGGGYGGPVTMALLDRGELRPDTASPRVSGELWWKGVDHLRDLGYAIPEYVGQRGGGEPVAPIPFAVLDALTGPDRERYIRKRGFEIPATDDARRQLRDTLFRELRAGNRTVLDAPTSLGKSYTVATEAWLRRADVTGEAPVIHTHPTCDARDEAAADTEQYGAQGAVLKGRKEISPIARGDHDPPTDAGEDAPEQVVTIDGRPASEWFDLMCDAKGLPFSTALALARDRNDQGLDDLPPVGEEDPAVRQWDEIPRDEDGYPTVDVIHATHQFLYVPSLRAGTNILVDEQPDFSVSLDPTDDAGLSQDRIRRMVTAYLQQIGAPVSTWESFVTLARFDSDGGPSDAGAEQDAVGDALGDAPPTEWFVENPDAHALAPDLTRAIWNALRWNDSDGNGRRSAKVFHEPPRLDADGEQYAGTWLSVVLDEDNTVRSVRNTPDLSQARAVVGLDAHPSMSMWQLNVGPNMTRDTVLDATERRLWRRYERGLTVVQIGEATRPRSGEKALEWMNDERVRTVLSAIREHYGDGFDTAIAPIQVERRVREILDEVVGDDLDDDHTLHYGEEKSRNPEAFADALAGYIYGCMDPGDDMILDAIAELGLDATPRTVETDEGDIKREKGRTFDGTDADTARELLASVRENHVAQAAGRYARSPDDPDDSAVVYVHTDAVPTGFADIQVPGVEWLATDLQREIIHTLAARPSATVREIADAVDCSKEHVRETLARLEERELVDRRRGDGDHGADVFTGEATPSAFVDLGTEQTTNKPLKEYSRWSLAIHLLHEGGAALAPLETTSSTQKEATSGGDGPPDTV